MLRFHEIPQFTPTGSYVVNMGMEFLVKQVDEWIRNEGLKMNPEFQRGHVWTEAQQRKFIEFILRGGRSGRDLFFNAPWWHRPVPAGSYDEFVCVDGLQRITAIRRFLADEIPVFGQTYSDFGDRTDIVRHSMTVHVNDLKTESEVLRWYIEMNEGGTPHSDAEIRRVRNMLETLERKETE